MKLILIIFYQEDVENKEEERRRGGGGGPISRSDIPLGDRNDRCTVREERAMEATRGRAKRRTRKIKVTYGTEEEEEVG